MSLVFAAFPVSCGDTDDIDYINFSKERSVGNIMD
jgi:hypothetical protein